MPFAREHAKPLLGSAALHLVVLAALVGLLVGSTRVLWPWPDGVDSVALAAPDSQVLVAAALCAGGFALVLLVTRASERVQHLGAADEVRELKA